jgi:hypothetical protein
METLSTHVEQRTAPRLNLENLAHLLDVADRQHNNYASASFESSLATMVIRRMDRK